MGRLIDVDVLVKYIKDFQDYMVKVNHKPVPVDAKSILDVFVEMAEKQQTAFDLEVVVQQLESNRFIANRNGDVIGERLCIGINDAIEIVRKGGVK